MSGLVLTSRLSHVEFTRLICVLNGTVYWHLFSTRFLVVNRTSSATRIFGIYYKYDWTCETTKTVAPECYIVKQLGGWRVCGSVPWRSVVYAFPRVVQLVQSEISSMFVLHCVQNKGYCGIRVNRLVISWSTHHDSRHLIIR